MSKLSRDRLPDALVELSGRAAPKTRPELLVKLLQSAMQAVPCDGVVAAISQARQTRRIVLMRGSELPDPVEHPQVVTQLLREISQHPHTVLVPDLSAEARIGREDACPDLAAGPAMFVPMQQRESEPGYLAVYRASGGASFTADEAHALTLLAAWGAVSLENLRLAESVEKLAITDDLTQVYNYRFLKTALRREVKRAGRYRQELAVLMLDVDNLKMYNDRHGHLRGSLLLREMAGLLLRNVRSWDLVAKYGGDEFTIILPQTGEEGAWMAAERLRGAVEQHAFPVAARGEITVSAGLACFPQDGHLAGELLQCADRALYAAKNAGRNRVGRPQRAAA